MTTTDQLDEEWDLYDRQMHIVGTARRRDTLPAGTFHLAVGCILFDERGNVLVQQRSLHKLSHPGAWELGAGGSALRGEDGPAAATREVQEEMQLAVSVPRTAMFARDFYSTWIEEWFVVQSTFALADVHMQVSEVAQVKLLPMADARKLLADAGINGQVARLDAAAALLGLH